MTENAKMANSLYEARLEGIMGVVFNKTYRRLGNAEYNYHDSLQARLIGGIGIAKGKFSSNKFLFVRFLDVRGKFASGQFPKKATQILGKI